MRGHQDIAQMYCAQIFWKYWLNTDVFDDNDFILKQVKTFKYLKSTKYRGHLEKTMFLGLKMILCTMQKSDYDNVSGNNG